MNGRNKIISTVTASSISAKSNKRTDRRYPPRYWARPEQTSSWWDNFSNDLKLSERWKENVHMCKESFLKLLPYMEKNVAKNVAGFRKTR